MKALYKKIFLAVGLLAGASNVVSAAAGKVVNDEFIPIENLLPVNSASAPQKKASSSISDDVYNDIVSTQSTDLTQQQQAIQARIDDLAKDIEDSDIVVLKGVRNKIQDLYNTLGIDPDVRSLPNNDQNASIDEFNYNPAYPSFLTKIHSNLPLGWRYFKKRYGVDRRPPFRFALARDERSTQQVLDDLELFGGLFAVQSFGDELTRNTVIAAGVQILPFMSFGIRHATIRGERDMSITFLNSPELSTRGFNSFSGSDLTYTLGFDLPLPKNFAISTELSYGTKRVTLFKNRTRTFGRSISLVKVFPLKKKDHLLVFTHGWSQSRELDNAVIAFTGFDVPIINGVNIDIDRLDFDGTPTQTSANIIYSMGQWALIGGFSTFDSFKSRTLALNWSF